MIKVENLCFKNKIYYQDFEIRENTINFISGDSGTGKSTLLKLFNKTETQSNGEIYYQGKNVKEINSLELRKEIKLISQNTHLFQFSIKENFNLYYEYCEMEQLSEDEMKYYLNLLEANFPLDKHCNYLSGGEKQRVYLAICLSLGGKLILLDEPTSALDKELSIKVLHNIIKYIKDNNKTLVVISHDQKLVEMYAENTVTLKGGINNE